MCVFFCLKRELLLIFRFALQLAGPMWSGPIHDSSFASEVLKHVDEDPGRYGTSTRMRGMLTVASEVRICSLYRTR